MSSAPATPPTSPEWSPTRAQSKNFVWMTYLLTVFAFLAFDHSPLFYKLATLLVVGVFVAIHQAAAPSTNR